MLLATKSFMLTLRQARTDCRLGALARLALRAWSAADLRCVEAAEGRASFGGHASADCWARTLARLVGWTCSAASAGIIEAARDGWRRDWTRRAPK